MRTVARDLLRRHGGGERFVVAKQLLAARRPVEARGVLRRGGTDRGAAPPALGERGDGMRHGGDVAGRREDAAHAIGDHLEDARRRRGDDWQAARVKCVLQK